MGKFVVFEGITGSGKTEMVTRTAEYLESLGQQTVITFEPGNGLLEASPEQMDHRNLTPFTKAMLLVLDRIEHVQNEIRPALEENWSVVCERYIDSMEAYQKYGQGLYDFYTSICNFNLQLPMPDVRILLDVEPEVGFHRKPRWTHSYDGDMSFQHRVREGYLRIFGMNRYYLASPVYVVQTSTLRVDEVWSEVKKKLDHALDIQA